MDAKIPEVKRLTVFFKRYAAPLFAASAVVILAFFHYIWNDNIRIDSVIFTARPDDIFNDINIGRFGIVLLNKLFFPTYIPHFVMFFTLVMLAVNAVSFIYLMWRFSGEKTCFLLFALPILVFSHPSWTGQFYFNYQSFLVLLSLLFCQCSSFLIVLWQEGGKPLLFLPALIGLTLAFSVYQAFMAAFLTICLVSFMLLYLFGDRKNAFYIGLGLKWAALFAASAILYFILNALAFRLWGTATDYLDSQVLWGQIPIQGVLVSLIKSIWSVIAARSIVDTPAYTVSVVCSLCCLILWSVKQKGSQRIRAVFPVWFLLQCMPFALIAATGGRTASRSELSNSFVIACNFLLSLFCAAPGRNENTYAGNFLRGAVLLCAAVVFCMQAGISFRMSYTDDVRAAQDYELAGRIVQRLEEAGVEEGKAVVFIGEHEAALNPACMRTDVTGMSFFSYHRSGLETNVSIVDYLWSYGYNCGDLEWDQVARGQELSESMPAWPAAGSVADFGDLAVVKLSEDPFWASEVMEPGIETFPGTPELQPSGYLGKITSIRPDSRDGALFLIRGWCYEPGVSSQGTETRVLLMDTESGSTVALNTARTYQRNVTEQNWRDGADYNQCGILSLLPRTFLEGHPERTFSIVLECKRDGEICYVNTNTVISLRLLARNS